MVPDYYAMLGVEPGSDRSTIESALAKNQPAWSSGTRNPKTKHTYQSYLDQIPALRQALLGEPNARLGYDAELAAARRVDRDRKLDALQKRVRLRAAKGGLTVGDRALLRDEAVKLGLTPADLDRLAALYPPRPEAPAAAVDDAEPAPDILDPVMRRQTRVALDHLHRRDLYDALELARDAPATEITSRADAERQRWMKKTQVTAEKTAWLEVITLAQSHLTNPQSRARYDRTLAFEAEDDFSGLASFALGGQPRLDHGTRLVLLDEAEKLGIGTERADKIIGRVCRLGGISSSGGQAIAGVSTSQTPARLLRCRSCQGVSDHGKMGGGGTAASAACRHCGASLHWSCPVCQRMHWVDEPRCSCGFRVELRDPLVWHFEAAQQAFRSHDYASALVHLKRVQDFAPKHVGARKGVEMVRQKGSEIELAKAAFELARDSGKLVAARRALDAWGRVVGPTSAEWKLANEPIQSKLREAQTFAARAKSRERTDPQAARELYRRSLAIATDLTEALSGLERCPPETATGLTAEYLDGKVHLRWSPPPFDSLGALSFVIVRKPETALQHPTDGVRIAEVTEPTYDDPDVVPGTSVSYAILTKRGKIESVAAVAVGPMFLLGEVTGLAADARQREVDLSWTPPKNASEVRVARKRGSPPRGPLDGEYVEATLDQAHDRGLEPDRIYQYGVFAVFRTAEGKSVPSRGVFVSALPHTPVRPPEAPSLTLETDGRLTLRWVEPSRGIVKLIRTTRPFPHPPGTRLAPIHAASLEGDWLEVSIPDTATDDPPPFGVFYYTPLTSWGGTVTVGHSVAHSSVTDPTDLRAARMGTAGRVHIRWRWSPHGSQSLTLARQGTPPHRRGRPQRDRRDGARNRLQSTRLLRDDLALLRPRPLAPRRLRDQPYRRPHRHFAWRRPIRANRCARRESRSHACLFI